MFPRVTFENYFFQGKNKFKKYTAPYGIRTGDLSLVAEGSYRLSQSRSGYRWGRQTDLLVLDSVTVHRTRNVRMAHRPVGRHECVSRNNVNKNLGQCNIRIIIIVTSLFIRDVLINLDYLLCFYFHISMIRSVLHSTKNSSLVVTFSWTPRYIPI